MFEKIKNFFKKKPKEEKVLTLSEDKTFENEIKNEPKFNNMEDIQTVIEVQKEVVSENKSETKSSLTFGK
jgi:hypothetical protein